jgi:hypothetical protein
MSNYSPVFHLLYLVFIGAFAIYFIGKELKPSINQRISDIGKD